MKIYFIRHVKTQANDLNIWQGISDVDVSDEGNNQIKELKKLAVDLDFDVIYSSPLKRAVKTANALKNKKNPQIIIDKNIIERNFGNLEMKEVKEGQKKILANLEINTDLNENVEKIQDMYEKRIKPFLLRIKKEYELSDKKIAIVSHSWIGRLISYFATNETNPSIIEIAPKNGTVQEYEI